MVRIISGNFRSRVFVEPEKEKTRITMDRVRETVFNIINYEIKNSIALDGFSGSGIIAGEFLSRGIKEIYVVEKDKSVFKITEENLKSLNVNNYHLSNNDLLFFLQKAEKHKLLFDFIYLDPPFKEKKLLLEVLNQIFFRNLLNKNGEIIVEWNSEIVDFLPNFYKIKKTKTFGLVFIFFLIIK